MTPSPTIIRHQSTPHGFLQVIAIGADPGARLQSYSVTPTGHTLLNHSEAFAAMEDAVIEFERRLKQFHKVSPPRPELPKDLAYVIELAEHRADMWDQFAREGSADLDCFYECDQAEMENMAEITSSAVEAVSKWFTEVKS